MKVKKAHSDFTKNDLPKNRRELFFDCLKERFSLFFLIGFFVLLFAAPIIVVNFFNDYGLAALSASIEDGDYSAQEIARMFISTISFYGLIKIPCYVVLGVGLSGLMRVVRNLCFGEGVLFSHDFFDGIKSNGIVYSLCFLFYGVINLVDKYIFYRLGANNILAFIPILSTVIVLLPIWLFILTQTVVYKNSLLKYASNGLALYYKTFLKTLIAVGVFACLLGIGLVPNYIVKYVLYGVAFLLISPFLMVIWFLYSCSVFDKYINKDNYPEIFGKGLYLGTEKRMKKLSEIRIRDPFILLDNGKYYMYGTTNLGKGLDAKNKFSVYVSKDLKNFDGPKTIFDGNKIDFWADRDYWAAEVHKYKDKYYLFGSFKSEIHNRATQILVSDKPDGEFVPLSNKPTTPKNWECLDGTFYQDDNGVPYMIFCREWVQVGDGEIYAVQLSDDLAKPVGKPFLLFKASDNEVVTDILPDKTSKVTDGPFVVKEDGNIKIIWSSYSNGRYCILEATSDKIGGKWFHSQSHFNFDGGHAMVFKALDGKKYISLHKPNVPPFERAVFIEI